MDLGAAVGRSLGAERVRKRRFREEVRVKDAIKVGGVFRRRRSGLVSARQ